MWLLWDWMGVHHRRGGSLCCLWNGRGCRKTNFKLICRCQLIFWKGISPSFQKEFSCKLWLTKNSFLRGKNVHLRIVSADSNAKKCTCAIKAFFKMNEWFTVLKKNSFLGIKFPKRKTMIQRLDYWHWKFQKINCNKIICDINKRQLVWYIFHLLF